VERLVTVGADHGVPEYGLRKAEAAHEAHFASAREAYEAGVPIALGTDFIGPALVPHGENALEAELFVDRVGMSEREAIESATRVAARTVPADDIGVLREGYRADLVAFEADPLADIGVLREPAAVYKDGDRVDTVL
jgi:Imidazolonepropionase and related amidohydrolases